MLNPALAVAIVGILAWRKLIYRLIWPGDVGAGQAAVPDRRKETRFLSVDPLRGRAGRQMRNFRLSCPFVTHPATLSHVNCALLFLFVA
jgi:hypothetical protein